MAERRLCTHASRFVDRQRLKPLKKPLALTSYLSVCVCAVVVTVNNHDDANDAPPGPHQTAVRASERERKRERNTLRAQPEARSFRSQFPALLRANLTAGSSKWVAC